MPDRLPPSASKRTFLSRQGLLAVVLIFIAGIGYQFSLPTGSDVSWLIVAAEKVLDGQRLYIDVIESNPPMAIFIYMPAVLIERLTGVSAEIVEILVTSAAVVGSLWLSAAIMAKSGLDASVERFAVFGSFVLMILPRLTFSEREHIALILMLPVFVLMAARAKQRPIPIGLVIIAGLVAGLGTAIKPHFVIAMMAPAVYLAIHRRSVKAMLGPENWIAGGVLVAFTALVLLAYPAYMTSIVPMEADTYIYLRHPLVELVIAPLFLPLIGVGVAAFVVRKRGGHEQQTLIFLIAAMSFALVYLEQGKGWRYQLYPAMALVFLTFGIEVFPQFSHFIAERGGPRIDRALRLSICVLGMVGLVPLILFCNYSYTISLPFVPQIEAVAPHARVFALSSDLGVGHPLSRAVGGTWVGSVCSQLITHAAKYRRDLPGTDAVTQARMEHWIDWDRDRIADAIGNGRPDVIVYDHATFDWNELVSARPDIGTMLDAYRKTADVDGVDLLVRRDLIAKQQSAELSHDQSR